MDRVIDQRYRVVEPIGSGGTSQVYLAQDIALGRQVAVKVLDEVAASDDTLRRLFVKEGRALAALSHRNVVAVHDVGEVDGLPFIVMEYVEGVSLKQRIERSGPLPLTEALRITSEIAAGLDFTHSRGIVHADLKPSNVLLDESDGAKICDFGIARTPQEDADTPQLYATALYVAPERVEGRPATIAADVYGLGLILYEMLVGRPPFTSGRAAVLLRDHVVRQPVPPSHLRPSLPREVDVVVLRALSKDPALRYQSAGELALALRRPLDVGTTQMVMTEPIQDFVPTARQSPVVEFLSTHGQPIRGGFFGIIAALPVLGLSFLAGFAPLPSLAAPALIAAIALTGQLGGALLLTWLISTALLFMFVPALALLFAALGLVLWLRDVEPEKIALAIAMPVTAPLGLAPALLLVSAAVHGLTGVFTVIWGALLTVIVAIASGQPSFGPFVQTGVSLQRDSLFGSAQALEARSAMLRILQPAPGEGRFDAVFAQLNLGGFVDQIGGLISRFGAADITVAATILAWIVAALVVWTITRVLRLFLDTLLRRRAWFSLYVFATAAGVTGGAAVLYMIFVTIAPLALAPIRTADSVLLVSAFVGAVLALAAGVVISATEPQMVNLDPLPGMSGKRNPVR